MKALNHKLSEGFSSGLQKTAHNLGIGFGGAFLREKAVTGPWRVLIGVTDFCNYKCIMCREHSALSLECFRDGAVELPPEERFFYEMTKMDFKLYCRLIDELAQLGTRQINISGKGEPFSHGDIMPMIEYARKNRFNITLTTNGSLLNSDKCEFLVDIGVDALYFSVHTGSMDSYKRITGIKQSGLYEKVKENIKRLSNLRKETGKKNPKLMLNFVLSSMNCLEMESMIRFAIDTGVDRVNLVPVSIYHEGMSSLNISSDDKKLMGENVHDLKHLADKHGLMHNLNEVVQWIGIKQSSDVNDTVSGMPCYAGWFISVVLSNGTVMPCCQCVKEMGNINMNSFKEIWNSPAYRKFRKESKDPAIRNKDLSRCLCSECSHVPSNLIFYKLLHPLKPMRIGQEELMKRLKGKISSD